MAPGGVRPRESDAGFAGSCPEIRAALGAPHPV